jgi:hypothetical protein
MRSYAMPAVLASSLLLCAGCGKDAVTLPGETPVYTISCDNVLEECLAGAKVLCGGPYEAVSGLAADGKTPMPGSFGWVDTTGKQQAAGGSSGKYTIRIRCR